MLKKKILFIVTVYRIGERIHPIIPKLYEFSDIDLLKVNEMSSDMNWYGTNDPRITFNSKYEKYFDNIFDGGSSSIEQYGARNEIPCDVIKNLNIDKYDLVIYDDDRNRHGVWYIFENAPLLTP